MNARILLLAGVTLALSGSTAKAQGALIKRNRLAGLPRLERISFGDSKPQDGDSGPGVSSVQQVAFPFAATFALSSRFTVDVGGAFTSGTVSFSDGSEVSLNGVSDVRVRATGKVLGEGLVVTVGANLPLGATSLDEEQLSAVRVLAAPGLGLQLPSVGFGPAGSVGLVATRPLGGWVGALGLSYEYRGTFSPIAALQAGAAPDFNPGNSAHVTAGLEGFVGDARLTVQFSGDFFTEDVLSVGGRTTQSLTLGPLLTVNSSLAFDGARIRDGRLYGVLSRRASFSRDGVTVAGGDGTYLSGGVEGGVPLGRSLDLHLAADLLSHTGLEVDNTLMTAQATSAALTAGLRVRGASGVIEPFVRLGRGEIASASFSAFSAGLSVVLRF